MYKFACKCDDKIFCYFDTLGNKYTVSGGNLSWRIRNPGLLRSRSLSKARNKPIGCYDGLAIFAEPEQGFEALSDWLRSKKHQSFTLASIAKYYKPSNLDSFITSLTEIVGVPHTQKVDALSKQEFENKLVMRDARLFCSFLRNPHGIKELENYITQQTTHYKRILEKISNVTILDPKNRMEHSFSTKCYQEVVQNIVKKYRGEK